MGGSRSIPQYTRADFGPEAAGSSNHRHITSQNVRPYGRVKVIMAEEPAALDPTKKRLELWKQSMSTKLMIQVLPNRVCSVAVESTDYHMRERCFRSDSGEVSRTQFAVPWNPASQTQSSSSAQQFVPRSSDVTDEECADTKDVVIGKAEQLIACPGSGSIDPREQDGGVQSPCTQYGIRDSHRERICEHVGKLSTLLSSS